MAIVVHALTTGLKRTGITIMSHLEREEKRKYWRAYVREWRKKNPGKQYAFNKNWRARNPKKRYAQKSRYYGQFAGEDKNRNHLQRWNEVDDHVVLYSTGVPDRVLHRILGRSVSAIQIRRYILRKDDVR